MIVAGLQFDIAWEEPAANFRTVDRMAREAAGKGAGLIVLPEMFATGFSMQSEVVAKHAAATREVLAGLARELSVHVIGGYAEAGEPRPKNACSLYAPDGKELLHYRKIHPFTLAGEDRHYAGGDALETAVVDGVRVTPLICYDLRFPEPFRAAAPDTDLFLVIANWPSKRRAAWSTLLRARAIENQAFLLGVNRVGVGGGQPHTGDSALLDPFGEEIAGASEEAAIVAGAVNPEEVANARKRFSFLSDRRLEVYRKLRRERGETPAGDLS